MWLDDASIVCACSNRWTHTRLSTVNFLGVVCVQHSNQEQWPETAARNLQSMLHLSLHVGVAM